MENKNRSLARWLSQADIKPELTTEASDQSRNLNKTQELIIPWKTRMAGKVSVNGGRIRKVTITEIEDENEWTWPDPCLFEDDNIIIEKTTEEIFEELENVVQDWKSKLEFVVADGLKKIKRSTKEKKLMMKYLPGEGTVKG